MTLTHGSLFTGYGGLDMAVDAVLGSETVWHCEYEPPTEKVPNPKQAGARLLAYRWPGVPNHGDVTTVNWRRVQPVHVMSGGSPCQDVSSAGKRAGMRAGTRSGLWASFVEAIATIRPLLVVWENVRGVLSADADSELEPCPGCVGDGHDVTALRALGRVLGDLADIGYDASWYGLPASDIGAPHGRYRIFVVAWPAADTSRRQQSGTPAARDGLREPAQLGAEFGAGRVGVSAGRGDPVRYGPSAHADCDGQQGVGRVNTNERDADGRRGAAGVRGAGKPASPAAHTDGHALRQQPVALARRGSSPVAGLVGADVAADSNCHGRGGRTKAIESGLEDGSGPRPDGEGRGARTAADADNPTRHGERTCAAPTGGSASATPDTLGGRRDGRARDPQREQERGAAVAWGGYEPAIRRWERLTRPAPLPWERGPKGGYRLAPRFSEWMMGLPAGWVTDVPGLSRSEQLKLIGNGVVPQQGATGITRALDAAPAWVRAGLRDRAVA